MAPGLTRPVHAQQNCRKQKQASQQWHTGQATERKLPSPCSSGWSYARALKQGLAAAPPKLETVAAVMSEAYFNCLSELGLEGLAISAALQGSEEMAKQQRRMTDEYIEILCAALRPFAAQPGEDLRILCVGLLGAAEAIARDVQASRTPQVAARTLTSLIAKSVGALGHMGINYLGNRECQK